jgi:hypothetical protein
MPNNLHETILNCPYNVITNNSTKKSRVHGRTGHIIRNTVQIIVCLLWKPSQQDGLEVMIYTCSLETHRSHFGRVIGSPNLKIFVLFVRSPRQMLK